MTRNNLEKYRKQLEILGARVQLTTDGLEEQARMGTGGDAAGNLSNTPMHLGDLGTEAYIQELNATLFENEEYIRQEISFALERLDSGKFGLCENCGTKIIAERLEILPYTRHCVRCAESLNDGPPVNINVGRTQPGNGTADPFDHSPQRETPVNQTDDRAVPRRTRNANHGDTHAAGTPGGGTAIGGLAGTTVGDGDPDHHNLEDAMGSGNFDVAQEELDEDEVNEQEVNEREARDFARNEDDER